MKRTKGQMALYVLKKTIQISLLILEKSFEIGTSEAPRRHRPFVNSNTAYGLYKYGTITEAEYHNALSKK